MKKIMQRFFGVLTSVALLVTSATPVFATSSPTPGHSHGGGFKIESDKGCEYTITLKHPSGTEFVEESATSGSHYGAYQIFSGKVEGTTETNPGGSKDGKSKPIPITDIKWGNAFGITDDMDSKAGNTVSLEQRNKNIVGFVIALATAKNGDYSYAFSEFDGFDGTTDPKTDFVKKDGDKYYLADRFLKSGSGNVNADSNPTELSDVDYDKLAVAVADVLAADNHVDNHEWLQAFTDILGGYAQGREGYLNQGYVDRYYEGSIKEGEPTKYEINVPAGYYMIRDLSSFEGETDESYSARMLFVANNVEQVLKEDIPKLDKNIVRDGGLYETEVAGVGDEVKFRLTGKLPGNYDLYLGGYQFIFTDTLSKGLTLKQLTGGSYDVTVTVKGVWNDAHTVWNDETLFTISTSSVKKDGKHTHDASVAYTINYDTSKDNNILTVSFPCLKEISITQEGTTYTLGVNGAKKSEIYIDYTAVVDKDAVVSPATKSNENGNTNTAVLTYSDNPQSYGDTDETKEDNANVYVFGLDIVKIDAAEFLRTGKYTEATLAGAKFALVRPVKDIDGNVTGWEIAKFAFIGADVDSEENLPSSFKQYGYYTITGWETIDAGKDQKEFSSAWIGKNTKYYGDNTFNIGSDENGHLNISGLDAGVTYTMVETEAPEGYATIDTFTITLTAQPDTDNPNEYNGSLKSAESNGQKDSGVSFSYDKPVDITDEFSTGNDGSANMLVANFKYIDLPSTGGVGTYLFYIIGGGIIVLSAVLFILSKKKTTK